MAWTDVAPLDELHEGLPHALMVDGIDLVAVRNASGLHVLEGRCPHQGALLSEGELDGSHLVCRNHGWRFDVRTGRRVGGSHSLQSCPHREHDGRLCVDTSAIRQGGSPAPVATRKLEDLPGPRGLALLGRILALGNDKAHVHLERWAAEYGPLYLTRAGAVRFLVVGDPELSAEILKARPHTFRRLGRLEPLFTELGAAGVFTAEGTAWRPQRRLAMQALASKTVGGFYPALKTVAERLLRRWDAAARAERAVDIHDDFRRFTIDVTTWLAFGHDANTIERGSDALQRKLELIFPALIRRTNALFPYWRFFRLPYDRRLDRAVAELQKWLRDLIDDTRARLVVEPGRAAQPTNFLEAMVAARDDDGVAFSPEVILGNAMTMLLAGEDTTSNTLAWAVHLLCDSPGVVDTLRAELQERLPHDPLPQDVRAASDLPYADAISNEVMRLRPAAPLLPLQANLDTVIADVAVPAGTPITLLMRFPVLQERHFAVPLVFEPERWQSDRKSSGAHDPASHMPFGTGPRICPGRALAMLEMRVVLATLYKNFTVERAGPRSSVTERFALTMAPDGLRVRLRRRLERD